MEFKITELQLPGRISFNYAELKEALTARVADYKTMVYTDDQIAIAKKDRAELNKLKKALNDERIRQEKEFVKPFETFKEQVKELCGIIDSATSAVDAQVKAFEEAQKKQKEADINSYWNATECPAWMIHMNPKWLNASCSLTSVQKEIDSFIEQANKDMNAIGTLPAFVYEAEEVYKRTFSLSDALEVAKLAKEDAERRAAWEAERVTKSETVIGAEPFTTAPSTDEIKRQWIGFQALLSKEEASALGQFMKMNGIKYKAI